MYLSRNYRNCWSYKMVSLLLIIFCANLRAEVLDALPGLRWVKQLGEDGKHHTYKAMRMLENGDLLIALGMAATGEPTSEKFVWWKINRNGEKYQEVIVNLPAQFQAKFGYVSNIKDIDINGDQVIILADVTKIGPTIIVLKKTGDVLFVHALPDSPCVCFFSKLIRNTDGGYLAIGSQDSGALLSKIDKEGKSVWSKVIKKGGMNVFVAGLPLENGGAFLISNFANTPDQLATGKSHVWIGKTDKNGKVEKEKAFVGRFGSAVSGPDNTFTIVYDKSENRVQDIHVMATDSNLNTKWEIPISTNGNAPVHFKIEKTTKNEFIVSGLAENFKPYIAKISNQGKLLLNFLGPLKDASHRIDLVSDGEHFFISSTFISWSRTGKFNNKIRITYFSENR